MLDYKWTENGGLQFDEISDFLVQTVERILIKKQIKVLLFYNYFSFVFSQFSLSAVFMKFVVSNWLSRPYFGSSEIGLLFRKICIAAKIISKNIFCLLATSEQSCYRWRIWFLNLHWKHVVPFCSCLQQHLPKEWTLKYVSCVWEKLNCL